MSTLKLCVVVTRAQQQPVEEISLFFNGEGDIVLTPDVSLIAALMQNVTALPVIKCSCAVLLIPVVVHCAN